MIIKIEKGCGDCDVSIKIIGDVSDASASTIYRAIHALIVELGPIPEKGYKIEAWNID